MNLQGKTVLVTGGTNGLGFEAAAVLAKQGGRIVITGRDAARTADAVAQLKQRSGSQTVESLLADYTSLADVRRCADEYRAKYDRLDVLVNNAGTVFANRTMTRDGIEATFQVNHLAPFLLTTQLIDLIQKSAPARVVNVSSEGHYRADMDFSNLYFEKGYGVLKAYDRSKLANVLFTRSLAKKLAGKALVNALHPGGVRTNIWSKAPWWSKPFLAIAQLMMLSVEDGAKTLVFLASDDSVEGKTGLYFDQNKPKTPSPLALDDALAERVWAESERRVAPFSH